MRIFRGAIVANTDYLRTGNYQMRRFHLWTKCYNSKEARRIFENQLFQIRAIVSSIVVNEMRPER